ncbi:hypothetical protein [Marinobacterium mangrovicola]|uniref:2',3'-cyclic-nucleotide 2'-phosphodiesterase (5'-nucleotidase family) n=1 Tax=Marinobacterium mangrovicola TaxID=1476959 RepID=A0A4R1GAN9_9GAMM|nr:hypothetical protein [Marinobacterium mangrovicola]TCK03545.1 2',3'-cyclic-nucleotide 2'-phosphodiesterase (5'-nucleotidase family) [Marinobacterium mangrovicola]
MIYNRTRRRLLHWLGAGMAVPALAGCAARQEISPSAATASDSVNAGAELELLYLADTLDTRAERLPALPALRLGPPSCQGQAPWLTGKAARSQLADADTHVVDWFDAGAQAKSQVQVGGYACLGALLDQLRREADSRGVQTLTLENGQCWNGSGLAYLTQGESGVQGSSLLGSEIRVSSEERSLWPDRAAQLYAQAQRAGIQTLAGALDDSARSALGIKPYQLLQRGGIDIAVVAATDPYALDEQRSLKEWFESLSQQVQLARREAGLVILLADTGTGPALWLSQRLNGVDLILAARGQTLWPQLVGEPGRAPVCLPGSGGTGLFRIRIVGAAEGWQFQADYLPALAEKLDSVGREQQSMLQQRLDQQRALHAAWLDQPVARAPAQLRRSDLFGGSWDQLIHEALIHEEQGQDYAGTAVLPGLRYEVPLAAGDWIRREHLLMLSASAEARVVEFEADIDGLEQLLEQSAGQLFAEPLLLDTSEDLPRILDFDYRFDYGRGRRIHQLHWRDKAPALGLDGRMNCRTLARGNGGDGEPLWQRLEQYLRGRPESWTLQTLARPQVQFVEGHPGWPTAAGGPA